MLMLTLCCPLYDCAREIRGLVTVAADPEASLTEGGGSE